MSCGYVPGGAWPPNPSRNLSVEKKGSAKEPIASEAAVTAVKTMCMVSGAVFPKNKAEQ